MKSCGLSCHECICLVSDSEAELNDEANTEKGGEEGIHTEIRVVAIYCAPDCTQRRSNVGAGIGGEWFDGHDRRRVEQVFRNVLDSKQRYQPAKE
jgi:hypothetical protein